jgi:transposase
MKSPKPIELDAKEMQDLKERVAAGALQEGDSKILEAVITTYLFLAKLLEAKNTSIKRLRRLLFGSKTEKADKVLDDSDKKGSDADEPPDDDDTKPTGSADGKKPKGKRKKRKGHGRNGADAYTGAERVKIPHESLRHGGPCPLCPGGKTYLQKESGVIVRLRGSAPIKATVYEPEKLRCNLCGAIFTAQAPEEAGEDKYDESAKAMIALLKYGTGMPFNRLENLQQSLGMPLPSSTQWDLVEEIGNAAHPAFNELMRQAAQGDIVYNDDTTNRVLDLIEENKTKNDDERTGIFTTGIVSTTDKVKIAIFHTGRRHAGENLNALLEKRDAQKDPPIQMADALTRNVPQDFKTILCNCNAHARRNFVDVTWCFPDECRHVIEALGKVYKYDEIAREENMSPHERLAYHQEQSGPVMEDLKLWLEAQFEKKLVEPNSGLGKAIKYMLKHWEKLTVFLKVPGAPIDNNLCERCLKRVILNRKNALFFKSEFGAYIGDMFMSLIHTCSLMKANPFEYLIALQKYATDVFKNAARWMPWNFKDTIASIEV